MNAMKEAKVKKEKKISHKLKNLGGVAFESMIGYKMVNKFFIEDIKIMDNNFNTQQSLNISDMNKEIINKLYPTPSSSFEENKKRNDFSFNYNNNVNDYYSLQNEYNTIYIESESSSNLSSNNELHKSDESSKNKKINSKNIGKKDITKLEFDLFLKNVTGKLLNNFLKEKKSKNRLVVYSKNKPIEDGKTYNVCVEITIKSSDIINKKIPHLYKIVSSFNFLFKTNTYFNTVSNDFNNESKAYFIEHTKFINYKDELIIIIISNQDIKSFLEINEIIEKKRKENLSDEKKNSVQLLDKKNLLYNYNIYMVYYPNYDDEEIFKLNEMIEDQQKKIEDQQKEINLLKQEKQKDRNEIERLNKNVKDLESKIDKLIDSLNKNEPK